MPAPPDSARPPAGCTATAPRPDIAAPPVTVQSGSGRALTLAWLVLLLIALAFWVSRW